MASKMGKPALLRNIVQRGYGAQAATQQASYTLPQHQPEVTTLPSGAVVASLENNSPISRVALVFKAGSRYESPNNEGAAHMVRVCAGLATSNTTAFAVTRSLQQAGGSLDVEGGREHISYGLEVARNNLEPALEVLKEVGTQPAFKPWEIKDNLRRVKTDLAVRDPTTLALDLLHRAAFRNTGLGNSLFVPAHHLGKLDTGLLSEYVAQTHLASRMAVVGLGVDHEALVSYAKGLGAGSGDGVPAGASGLGGGEIRHETGAPVTVVAVAGPGASLGSSDAVALAVAQQVLGVGPGTKYGSNASSVLAKAVASSGGVGAASAININYSDTGLFGYCIVADSASADKVMTAAHNAVRGLRMTEADTAMGKNRVKAALLMAAESGAECVADMGLQTLLSGKYASPAAAVAAVDAVTPADVDAALKKVRAGKMSMSAVGSVARLPYLDQL